MNNARTTLLRLLALLALVLGALSSADAATSIYGIRGTGTGANNIIRLDPTTGAVTVVYLGYPGGTAATIAQCPNGLIYYAINTAPFQLFVFNPQTPTVAPTAVGPGLGQGALRMACSPGGVLYYMTENATFNLRTVNTTTGVFIGAGVTVNGAIEGTGGDMAFNSTGTLFGFNNTSNLFTIPLGGGAVTQVGTGAITGLTGSGIGLAFTDTDAIRVLTNASPGFYSVNTGTNPPSATSISSPPGGAATGDLASINVPNPDLSITKSANISSVAPGVATAVIYTIVVTNSSAYRVSGTVTDTFPAGVSAVSWTCSTTGVGSTCVTVPPSSGSGDINTIATLAPGGTATYTVNATVTAAAPVVNTASVALPFTFLTDATPANNSASNTILIRPTVSKSFSPATIASGGISTLTVTLANANGVAMTAATFTDVFPTSPGAMTVASPLTTSNTCGGTLLDSGGGGLAVGDVGIRLTGGTIPANGSCVITVRVTAVAAGVYTNTIAVGALTTSAGSNAVAANATLTVALPSFTVAKSVLTYSDPFNGTTLPKAIPGAVVTYSIQVTNTGAGTADTNTTLIVDAIPANTQLYVGNLGAPAGPIAFVDGTPSSGLTYNFNSLGDGGDDVSFSNSGCSPFTSYTPVPDVNGFAAVTCIRINPKGVFAAASGGNNPSFQVRFRVRVN